MDYTPAEWISDVADQEDWIRSMSALRNAYYKLNETISEFVKNQLSKPVYEFLQKINFFDKPMEEQISTLGVYEQQIRNMTVARLTIAYNPTEEIYKLLVSKIKEVFGTNSLLELVVHRSILGGAVIEAGGKIIDKSFKASMPSIKEANSDYVKSFFSL